jgi:hypothetical protein
MLTINEIATRFGVDVKAATGFVHFVGAMNAVKRGSAPSNGQKGKPPSTYGWSEGGLDRVIEAMMNLPEAPAQVEAAPATATVESTPAVAAAPSTDTLTDSVQVAQLTETANTADVQVAQ